MHETKILNFDSSFTVKYQKVSQCAVNSTRNYPGVPDSYPSYMIKMTPTPYRGDDNLREYNQG